TDGRPAYVGLSRLGYSVRRLNAGYGASPEVLDKVVPRVHRVSALLKRWILGIHQGAVRVRHLPAYLNEFTFRFNRRGSPHRGMLFYRLAQQAVAIEPLRRRKQSKLTSG
ncbi:MAG: transposase, partial [Elusimicrobia bacterium]|nr:transposase [Elusimicrobiota bacterium]